MVVGKSPKVSRRAPDEMVSPHEKERLVNMATKLIVATVSDKCGAVFLGK